jgi:hypothetical protein
MLAPLRTIMALLAVTSIAGAVLVALLSLGWVGWMPFVVSGVAGLLTGVPFGIWIAREIKRQDPAWPPRRPVADPGRRF